MGQYEIEVVEIPVPQKPKGKWDDFVEVFKKLDAGSQQSFFVPVKGKTTNIKTLKELTSKALNKENLKSIVYTETHRLDGEGLRFWSSAENKPKKTRKPRGPLSPESIENIKEGQRKRRERAAEIKAQVERLKQ
jgi:hypothetical protein